MASGVRTKHLNIYRVADRCFLNREMPCGVALVGDLRVAVVSIAEGAQSLGECALAVLKEANREIAWPTDWKAQVQPLLDAAHMKTMRSFAKRAALVAVSTDDDITFAIKLQAADGKGRGWYPGNFDLVASNDASDVGSKILEAFSYGDARAKASKSDEE